MAQVFERLGSQTRHLAAPLDWHLQPRGWRDRNAASIEVASNLFRRAATRALENAGRRLARDVAGIRTVFSADIATPSLATARAGALGFSPEVPRIPVFGRGCAEGVAGLAVTPRAVWPGARPKRLVCHPGGTKVIAAMEQALDLPDGTFQAERAVMARHGNMSARTVLSCGRTLRAGPPEDALLIAFGPGFSLAGLRLGAGEEHGG